MPVLCLPHHEGDSHRCWLLMWRMAVLVLVPALVLVKVLVKVLVLGGLWERMVLRHWPGEDGCDCKHRL